MIAHECITAERAVVLSYFSHIFIYSERDCLLALKDEVNTACPSVMVMICKHDERSQSCKPWYRRGGCTAHVSS
jgi:hypothetical protein